ncbi:MAG: hypothetical protein M3077_10040 [Candidatus Dormibacteraeota bacterium]|nr:hypothetical protein [Candidatus Dormibacteraeota bacterium]
MPNDIQIDTGFSAAYRTLESRMKALAEADGDVFLPNPEPAGPVEHVLICMEPSLRWWSRDAEDAKAKIAAGFRNFVFLDHGTLSLHFSIREYLCGPGERYYLTDISKGVMAVKRAGIDRTKRWDRWYPLLLDELNLVARAGAHIFAVGDVVDGFLSDRSFPSRLTKAIHYSTVMHYSPQNVAHRKKRIAGHEADFEEFKRSLSIARVLARAKEVMTESLPPSLRDLALARLTPLHLFESDLQLIFIYKLAFEAAVASRATP